MTDALATVRRVRPGDWSALRGIRLEALADTPEAYGSTLADVSTWPDERWRLMAGGRANFLAEVDGRVVGMVAGGTNNEWPGTRWMYAMYVTPETRGTGVADDLVEMVSQWARDEGVGQLYLSVTATVARARAFYERMGFRLTGTTTSMSRDPGVTLVTMVRDLD
ncbi:MAG TPA: GNAT family N-acetyltransferase [Acidimicrobiales bacterium]|nr:GNAT family N-acetyltransferase [Acidimicrobiales bacterium]